MADLTDKQSAQSVKLIGCDSTATETNPVNADANGNLLVKDYSNGPVTPGAVAPSANLIGGQYNVTPPSMADTQQAALQIDSKGRLIVSPPTYSYFRPVYTTRIQSVAATNGSNATTLAATIAASQAGSLIVVCASSQTGALTCTDNLGQTYSTAVSLTSSGHQSFIFYKANSAAGVTSVTITDASSTALNIIVSEYANVTAVTPLDRTASNTATSTSFTSTATAATTQGNELLIGCVLDTAKNNVTFTAGTGWLAVNTIGSGVGAAGGTLFLEEDYVSSTGTYTATGTISANDLYIAEIATFKILSYPTGFTILNSPTLIKSGSGTLSKVVVSVAGTGGASVTFYDNTTNSGIIIAVVNLTALGTYVYDAKFTNGLTMVVNSMTADFTVTYD